MTFKMKTPDAPMSFKQGMMIRNLGGGDVREEGLTMQQASDRIGELMAAKGTKESKPSTFVYAELLAKANQAGVFAAKAVIPTPMIVSGYENEPVMDGPCGFAWVNFKMKGGLGRKFGRWLIDNDHARKDSYNGGVTIWISDYNQSVTRKAAHASAMAAVLHEAGIENAYADSRLD